MSELGQSFEERISAQLRERYGLPPDAPHEELNKTRINALREMYFKSSRETHATKTEYLAQDIGYAALNEQLCIC